MLAEYFSYEAIAILMFATMLVMLLTGQRVFGAIGFVAAAAASAQSATSSSVVKLSIF